MQKPSFGVAPHFNIFYTDIAREAAASSTLVPRHRGAEDTSASLIPGAEKG